MIQQTEGIKLTQYSQRSGCGCKIPADQLETIIGTDHMIPDANLLVGIESKDDAALYDLGDGTAVISTTDFFTPMVNDPVEYGRIAAVSALNNVYAMGGVPMMALAVLGWPTDKLPVEVAQQVIQGARQACQEAGIHLAGGHSIISPEPIFGLNVSGRVNVGNIRTNTGAHAGQKLFLTKPLGMGIYTQALKEDQLSEEHLAVAKEQMTQLNKIGEVFSKFAYVKSMTDVSGFGLVGHLMHMCEASRVRAELIFDQIPLLPGLAEYVERGLVSGGMEANFEAFESHLGEMSAFQRAVLCDPQISGGLLVSVVPEYENEFVQMAKGLSMELISIGSLAEIKEGHPTLSVF
ncbi:selenide, water dikinase SelD [Pontibacter sp. G13]|uniref:selenide, water dikinase SelD n=1 Tax=Pontibacter sp. G13 TaxID=3074898 RepID=UPI002889B8FF|nr:selenide, water dikinase SelD [Pontibacter sp. G13]WNJ21159.1 selenide, water dikinase SelD [Pontibacter sp. G13]